MDPGDKEPSAVSVESFFQATHAVIGSVFPNVEKRESYREELKDHSQNLLIRSLRNSPYGTFIYLKSKTKTMYKEGKR
uniref:Ras-GEF domain-containing protein n=1 Tax=Strongyloides papillosus TaxID=174720 RepID=A0A0N5C4W9_STREA